MRRKTRNMRNTELRLIAELMRNSRRSDRELARVLRVSQPTVTRVRARLEKEGVLREYTVIPDFRKLGFQILSVSLTRLKEGVRKEDIESKRKQMLEMMKKEPISRVPISRILHMNGVGFGSDKVLIALHTDYSAYATFMHMLRANPLLEIDQVNSFLIDLTEGTHFLGLTMSEIADFLTKMMEEAEHTSEP